MVPKDDEKTFKEEDSLISNIRGNVRLIQYVSEEASKDAKLAKELAAEAMAKLQLTNSKIETLNGEVEDQKESSEETKARVSKLEIFSENHEQTLISLLQEQKTLNEALGGIQKTMIQIKWATFGALGMFVAQSFGIQEIIKSLFKMS